MYTQSNLQNHNDNGYGDLWLQNRLKGLRHARMCLHLFADSGAYFEQMVPIPSSNGSLDRALCAHLEPSVMHFSDC